MRRVSRRNFLGTTSLVLGALPLVRGVAAGQEVDGGSVFRHGVASGDPLTDRVLLWTRVSVEGCESVRVRWIVATDPRLSRVVARGEGETGGARDFTVKVDVTGLEPGTTYYYAFESGKARSPIGRTRTLPPAGVSRVRLGVVSCANYPSGYFNVYQALARRADLDAVLHLGDYIYEYAGDFNGEAIRPHEPPREVLTLADYRQRHAQYKTDEHLKRLHALVPFIATWDDHEVADNAWSGGAANHQPDTEGDYAARKAAAHQAYFEWMPVRNEADKIYRRLRFGLLAELFMLDLRSYRSQQVAIGDGGADDPNRTLTGAEQMAWLENGLTASESQWKLVGNSVMIAPFALPPLSHDLLGPLAELLGIPSDGLSINPDQWDGYAADRRRLLGTLASQGVRDTVFLTGDIHSSWASDVPRDAGLYPLSPSVATEFVCTSITSDNIDEILGVPPRSVSPAIESAIRLLNRHIKYVELDSHGASVLEVTPSGTQMDWYYLANKADPASVLTWAKSFRTRAGTQKVQSVGTPIGN